MTSTNELVAEATTTHSRARLRELSGHRDKAVRAAVAQNPATPDQTLEALVGDKHHLARYGVAENPRAGAWLVALAAKDPGVRVMLAQRQDIDEEIVEALANDPERTVRESLAWSSKRRGVLRRLSRDADSRVRGTTALNPALAEDDLEILARDRVANVRACAAQSTRLKPETVLRLATDRSYMPRYEILLSHPGHRQIAEILQDDANSLVAHLAKGRLNQML